MSDFEKFKEGLPSKEKFYSQLAGKKNIHKEYEHVFKVWNTFQMITMKDYHDLYLKCDVLLLAYVFEGKQKQQLELLWIISESSFERTSFTLQCNAQYDKN